MRNRIIKMAEMFKTFGDFNRLRIIKLLASNMVDTVCVSDLAKNLGITESATSQHIKILKNLGILRANKIGFRVYYSIEVEEMKKIKKEMDGLFDMAFLQCDKIFDKDCDEINK